MAIYHVSNGTAKRMDGAGDGSLYAPVTSIATPENGSTASKAYAVGEMFIRDGKLCTCTVAISAGGTFAKGTNYSEGSVGEVLSQLNSKQVSVTAGTGINLTANNVYIQGKVVCGTIGVDTANTVACSISKVPNINIPLPIISPSTGDVNGYANIRSNGNISFSAPGIINFSYMTQ